MVRRIVGKRRAGGDMSTRCAERIRGSPAANWETHRTCCGTSTHKVERRVDGNRAKNLRKKGAMTVDFVVQRSQTNGFHSSTKLFICATRTSKSPR